MYTKQRLRTVASMAQTAARDPAKVPPYLRAKASQLRGAHAAPVAWWRTAGLPAQRDRLAALRENDEWLLIVLDAGRYDIVRQRAAPLLAGDIDPVRSVGHDTFEWLQRAWPGDHDVTYVSGAVPVNSERLEFDAEDINHLYAGYQPTEHIGEIVDVWRDGWDESLGACPPETVTDAAVERRDADRLVVHYQQPHAPYIGRRDGSGQDLGHANTRDATPADGEPTDKPIWERVRSGETTDAELRDHYRANVDRVLGEVVTLLAAVGGEFANIALTADHGEALGECNVYAHPRWPTHPHVRTVPWVWDPDLTGAGRRRAREAEVSGGDPRGSGADVGAAETEERLRALGYR